MKTTLKKGDTAYFFDWRNEHKKVPVVIQRVKRTYCYVSALTSGINIWEVWDVPIEYLKPTKDFTVEGSTCHLLGDWIMWKEDK
tara:strand:+ start:590 stop:841 length:252 start_codon:yes stop_codon:yes gene_type:complete